MQVQPRAEGAAATRPGLIWRLLDDALSTVRRPDAPPSVLDCGGGSGTFAVPLAEGGAHVTVVDVSVDALATLRRRAAEAGVAARVEGVQGDVEALGDTITAPGFDLVLAHGILDAVQDVPVAFAAIAGRVRPGGLLSILVANPAAAVLARALAGDLDAALAELRALDGFGSPGPDAVRALCRAEGLVIEAVHGIGVFADLVPGRALDAPGAREALDELEADSATRAPFCEIAARVHVRARRLPE